MLSFENDYNVGCAPEILEAFAAHNLVKTTGYGSDEVCASAKEKIRARINQPDAEVYFLTGGTQTNSIVVDALLQPFEGVVAADTGHISVHEAGAVEYTGRKVLTIPGKDGKLQADDVRAYVSGFYKDSNHEHMVFPGMVYISFPTEMGTIYSKKELTDLYAVCQEYDMPLFIDGARLAYGLASPSNDLSIEELAALCDAFYIGGTKCGAMFGEAVVFKKEAAPKHFVNFIKKHGALLAKGFLLGIQYDVLFTDDLYFKLGQNAMDRAMELKALMQEKGFEFFFDSPTNQQFFVVDNDTMNALKEKVQFSFWEVIDENHTAIRFVTSWATKPEEITALKAVLD